MDETRTRDPIPKFETLDDVAAFWDTHSTADYDDLTHEVHFDVKLRKRAGKLPAVALVPELSETLQALANARGISLETLVNVWLTEKVLQKT
jgi:hypothetical protein